jgi:hypothetical protein
LRAARERSIKKVNKESDCATDSKKGGAYPSRSIKTVTSFLSLEKAAFVAFLGPVAASMLRHQHVCSSYVINPTVCQGIGGAVKRFSGYFVPVIRDPQVVAVTELEGSTEGLLTPLGTTPSTYKSFEEAAGRSENTAKPPVPNPNTAPAPTSVNTIEGEELESLKEKAKEAEVKKDASPKTAKRKATPGSPSQKKRKRQHNSNFQAV